MLNHYHALMAQLCPYTSISLANVSSLSEAYAAAAAKRQRIPLLDHNSVPKETKQHIVNLISITVSNA